MNQVNWIEILLQSLAMGLGAFLLYITTSSSRDRVIPDSDGFIYMIAPAIYKYLGWLSIYIVIVFIGSTFITSEEYMWILTLLMVLIFGGPGILCILIYYNHQVKFNTHEIYVKNWRNEIISAKWSSIIEITYHPNIGHLKLRTQGKVLKINHHLKGLLSFYELMESKTKWTRRELKIR